MKLFFAYLHSRLSAVGLFFLCCGLFTGSLLLYRLPVQAVLYPAVLCLLLFCIGLTVDFFRIRSRHQLLSQAVSFPHALPTLPEGRTLTEQDLLEVIDALRAALLRAENAADAHLQDTLDYFTLWTHQIKTPIASMRLALENEDSPLSRKLNSQLFAVEQYVEMAMVYLRLDSVSTDYVFHPCELDDIIRGAVRKYAPEFIGRRLRLEYEPISLTLTTDEKWFSFVLEQVLSNALKYTREGGVRIWLSAPDVLCIQDTGMGIAPEDLPRIFEKGYTGSHGRSDKKASGLGLYLCKTICGRLGMDISARSVPGQGTQIFLRLTQYSLRPE